MARIEAARLNDWPAGSALEFRHAGWSYLLVRLGDGVACIDAVCPHQGGSLAAGPPDGSRVTCSRKGCLRWSFDVRTGQGPPPGSARVSTYPASVEGGVVRVDLPGD